MGFFNHFRLLGGVLGPHNRAAGRRMLQFTRSVSPRLHASHNAFATSLYDRAGIRLVHKLGRLQRAR